MEIWKDVIGYECRYKVSNYGRVKSLNYNGTYFKKILSPCNRNGYPSVTLFNDGIRKHRTIHSLVAESFIDKDYKLKGLVVNHKNFKRYYNVLSNLELITPRDNTNLKHKKHSSKYTGVSWNKRENKWESWIVVNGLQKYLGKFKEEEEASKYYEDALICINNGKINDIKTNVRTKSSVHNGLCFIKKRNNWRVTLPIDGKRKYLGSFNTEQEAYSVLIMHKIKHGIEF